MIKFALMLLFVLPACASAPQSLRQDSSLKGSDGGASMANDKKRRIYTKGQLLARNEQLKADPNWVQATKAKIYVSPGHAYFRHTPLSPKTQADKKQ